MINIYQNIANWLIKFSRPNATQRDMFILGYSAAITDLADYMKKNKIPIGATVETTVRQLKSLNDSIYQNGNIPPTAEQLLGTVQRHRRKFYKAIEEIGKKYGKETQQPKEEATQESTV